jgi:NADH-quinone oxidoreductase subunit A
LTIISSTDTISVPYSTPGSGFLLAQVRDNIHKVGPSHIGRREGRAMESGLVPILLFVGIAAAMAVGMLLFGAVIGPRRTSKVKEMPYESGVDPAHDTHRKFDVRFHLVAIAFLVFDVELLFLYPWAVASRDPAGFDAAVQAAAGGLTRGLIFGEALVFIGLLAAGLVYAWRKGVFQWR